MQRSFVRILFKNEAIVTGTGDEKYGFRLNSDMKRGKFKVGESVNYSRWESEMEANSGFPGIYQVTNMDLSHVCMTRIVTADTVVPSPA